MEQYIGLQGTEGVFLSVNKRVGVCVWGGLLSVNHGDPLNEKLLDR